MTEEKKGVSAWLRGIVDESYGKESRPLCTGITETFFGVKCREMHTCGSCILAMFTAIADRIDAERALPEGIEWPRFEDGELVKVGDEVEFEGEAAKVLDVALSAERFSLFADTATASGRIYGDFGERVKRPTPKVLGADGAPINVGDTVYCDDDPEQLIVDSFDDPGCVYLKQAKAHMSEANGIMSGHISKLKALEEENDDLKAELADWKGNAEGFQPDAYMKLPLDADGEPLHVGDAVYFESEVAKVCGMRWNGASWSLSLHDHAEDTASHRCRLVPTAALTGADGVPIGVGDIVYRDDDPEPLQVDLIYAGSTGYCTVRLKDSAGICTSADAPRLSHKKPEPADSWEFEGEYDDGYECLHCGKQFFVEKRVDITYTSKRRIEDMPEGWVDE